MAPNTPAASKEKAASNLGEIIAVYPKQSPPSPHESSQAGMVNVMAHSSYFPSPTPGTLERNSTPNPPELQANSITLPDDVLHCQEEMNNAMVHLLTFRASVDIHWQRLISESEITHHQNETKASKAINGVETHYTVALHDTEAIYATAMREAEATCLASTREAEATHATAVREVEAAGAVQSSKLQQTHPETMLALEDKALEGERHSHQSFLQACGVALQACPHKALGILMYPIHSLTGNMSLTSLLMATPQLPISSRDHITSPSHCRRPTTAMHPTGNKWQHSPRHEAELDYSRNRETHILPQGAAPTKAEGGRSLGRAPKGHLQRGFQQGLGPSPAYKADLF